ncbi:sigma 54-interacting transcriptional regulator [Spirosoma jeollabukense]
MKKSKTLDPFDGNSAQTRQDGDAIELLQTQINLLERDRDILLDLGNDITKVREKNDLITLFTSRIKGLFYFTHAIISLVDWQKETYNGFLLDPYSSAIKNHKEYDSITKKHFSLNEPFIQQVMSSGELTCFTLEKIMNAPNYPSYLRANFESGVREIMMAPLKSKMQIIGFLHIYSDRLNSFTPEFRSIIKGIAPQISSAVSNIIKNEELKNKEWVNEVLLALSNDMVTVRNRRDLLNVINSGLRKLIPFTNSVMTILDETGQTYNAFLTDPESKSKNFSLYTEAISIPYSVNDGIYDVAARSEKPVLFDMKTVNTNTAPLWFKLNYAAGAREMMIKALPGDETPKHTLLLFSDEPGTFDHYAIQIIERISSQLSTAASNISVNEEILNKESEKSFLLDFSQNIAAVRTKADLEVAISSVLQQVLNIRLAMIRIIDDDGITLSPYMYDKEMFSGVIESFDELASKTITVTEPLSARVLTSKEPVIFNIAAEEKKGNKSDYIQFWKKVGFKNAYGAALRVGNVDQGTLWLLTDEINLTLLRGICAQISIAISNIRANEKVLTYKQLLEVENDQLKEQIKTLYNFSDIIGSGAEMQKVYHLMSLVAESNSTVLLLGETGTGKELIARAIHNASPRKNKVMIKVNCAALPANLIESELFGHERGAFTGAVDKRIGKFELAHNSTLFLDEIGEMPLESQVKLLRVLQEKELERVGGRTPVKVDVRIIAATNRNLEEEVKAGRFRSDLYYRLNVFPIHLPPLRNRPEDIAPLANFFVARYSKNAGRKVSAISPKVIQELKAYSWPGNVRELEHLIERSVLLTHDTILREIHLPTYQSDRIETVELANRTLDEVERSYIIDTLKRFSGKISGQGGAADFLAIPSTTLHSKIKKLGINKSDYFSK